MKEVKKKIVRPIITDIALEKVIAVQCRDAISTTKAINKMLVEYPIKPIKPKKIKQ